MPRLTKAERAELEAKLKADDDADDDFEIEIWEGEKGAKVPYSKGGSWFERTFGGPLVDDPDDAADDADAPEGKKPAAKTAAVKPVHFGRRTG